MADPTASTLLALVAVSKTFRRRDGHVVNAVNEVTMHVDRGETVALVGESGSGKSSLARIALSLIRPDAGSVFLNGVDTTRMPPQRLRSLRRHVQPIFQDPTAALNPRRSVAQHLAQACLLKKGVDPFEKIAAALESVGLTPASTYVNRFPHELSGGQRQRVGIARAIAAEPKIIIADEPLSGADVSIRGQILNLLLDLQQQLDLAYLFITHDIWVARAFAHRVLVMYRGSIVEEGPVEEVIDNPQHDYTRLLVSAVPMLDREQPIAMLKSH